MVGMSRFDVEVRTHESTMVFAGGGEDDGARKLDRLLSEFENRGLGAQHYRDALEGNSLQTVSFTLPSVRRRNDEADEADDPSSSVTCPRVSALGLAQRSQTSSRRKFKAFRARRQKAGRTADVAVDPANEEDELSLPADERLELPKLATAADAFNLRHRKLTRTTQALLTSLDHDPTGERLANSFSTSLFNVRLPQPAARRPRSHRPSPPPSRNVALPLSGRGRLCPHGRQRSRIWDLLIMGDDCVTTVTSQPSRQLRQSRQSWQN